MTTRRLPTLRAKPGGSLLNLPTPRLDRRRVLLALAAPTRTPPEVILRLNQAANDALAQPAVRRQLRTLGVRPPGGTPEQLRQ